MVLTECWWALQRNSDHYTEMHRCFTLTFPTVLCDYAFSMLKLKNKILKQLTGNESSICPTAAD
jgi:hypothetical protein